ncbi:heterokaryon incompatibility protein-domain-containing protein [Podospora fimiseda]|uniref:Heterokaryon incompatibility protein-domain-containing protein n=1 Tax=Podospora fimiseda TaxID=252190 RepID=A0AAN6YPB6_9PEZI|nr:heterokaryon incompatibility protein-domain-containing protein [Podospora fimiseda]
MRPFFRFVKLITVNGDETRIVRPRFEVDDISGSGKSSDFAESSNSAQERYRPFLQEIPSSIGWDQLRDWLAKCKQDHEKCTEQQIKNLDLTRDLLPARLVYVGTNNGREPRLLDTKDQPIVEYARLTHCWGDSQPLQTLKSNLEQHRTAIPLATLPNTFRDAVIVTRKLNREFLWIDSLCIIQDSTLDWELECAKMAIIYQRSSINICAPRAPDSSSGLLQRREPPEDNTCIPCRWQVGQRAFIIRSCGCLDRDGMKEEGRTSYHYLAALRREEMSSGIGKRGGIFQEYLLSPRTLFFGPSRTYWECFTQTQFEDTNAIRNVYDWCCRTHSRTRKAQLFRQISDCEVWQDVVHEYTSHLLTRTLDKLPAVFRHRRVYIPWARGPPSRRGPSRASNSYSPGTNLSSLTWVAHLQEQIHLQKSVLALSGSEEE